MAVILQMKNITKEYKGVAFSRMWILTWKEKEIHAMVAKTAAGKSTLTKILAGAVSPTKGEIILRWKTR